MASFTNWHFKPLCSSDRTRGLSHSQQRALPGIEGAEHVWFSRDFNTNRQVRSRCSTAMPYPKVEDVYVACGVASPDDDFSDLYLKVSCSFIVA